MLAALLALTAASAAAGIGSADGDRAGAMGEPPRAGIDDQNATHDSALDAAFAELGGVDLFLQSAAAQRVTPTTTPPIATSTVVPAPSATAQPSPTHAPSPAPPAPAPTFPSAPPPPPQAPTSTPVPPAPPPPSPPPPAAPSGLDTAAMDPYSAQLFDLTNGRRIANGLPPLRANGSLNGIARIRSRDMADHNYFAHTSPVTGDTAFSLMDAYGVPYAWAGENLAKNNYPDSETVAVAEQALWDSPAHRENILNPHYTDVGIALGIDPSGMKYFTFVFTGPA